MLNPGDYVIPSLEKFRVLALVIAENKAQSDLSMFDEVSKSIYLSLCLSTISYDCD